MAARTTAEKQEMEREERAQKEREQEAKAFELIVQGFESLPPGRAPGILAYVNERFSEKKDSYR